MNNFIWVADINGKEHLILLAKIQLVSEDASNNTDQARSTIRMDYRNDDGFNSTKIKVPMSISGVRRMIFDAQRKVEHCDG